MANPEHLKILEKEVEIWNTWRAKNSFVEPDLTNANLRGIDRYNLDLSGTNLQKVDLREARLIGANLRGANLRGADLSSANLRGATLLEANLQKGILVLTDLLGATLDKANLAGANLCGANLRSTVLVETNLKGANLTNCHIYGISAWNVKVDQSTKQTNLIITKGKEPKITVDNLQVAQFIYLLLNNKNVRDVIDTITSKVVLILGRFTPERKAVLDAIKEELRRRNYSPVLFDFEKPASRDLTETISTLAHMARFVIADLTDAKSLPQELQAIVPNLPSVPVVPLVHTKDKEYGMFEHFKRYPWVLQTIRYNTDEQLIVMLGEQIIGPAETKFNELTEGQSRTS